MPQDKDELLRELVEKYAKMYMKMAYDNGVPYNDSEDIAFDALWAFYRSEHFGKLDDTETKAMMACIVKRKCIDFYRKNSHYEKISLDEEGNELEYLRKCQHKDPLDSVIEDEEYAAICACLEDLKEIWRDLAVMYFIEGYTEAEICEILGISGALCRSRIARARKFLKEKLKHLRRPD